MESKNICKILVVDDNPANLLLLVDMLSNNGYEINVAKSGEDAIKIANSTQPDLILLDIMMPDMDGFKICRALKSSNMTHEIPIIFITALSDVESLVGGFEAGGVDYITKPYKQAEVRARVNTHLSLYILRKKLQVQNSRLEAEIHEKTVADQKINDYTRELEEKNARLDHLTRTLLNLNNELDTKVQERTEEVRHQIKLKNDLINHIGHDLRTPLTPIMGLLPNMKRKINDPELQEMFNVIINNIERMKRIVDTTIKMTNIQTYSSNITNEGVDLRDMAEQVIQEQLCFAFDNGVEIRNLIPHGKAVLLSEEHVHSIYMNVINNGIRYNKRGGHVTLSCIDTKDGITIEITDNGIGMTNEDIKLIFEPFYKADKSRHGIGTSGLGLTILARIITLYEGSVKAESEGREYGSKIVISLPSDVLVHHRRYVK